MGEAFRMRCNDCRAKWMYRRGEGAITRFLHCDRCGKEKVLCNSEGEISALPCDCGGTFIEDAPIICPKCKSANVEFCADRRGRIEIITID